MTRIRWKTLLVALVVMCGLMSMACGATSSGDVKLGVPYHAQAQGSLDCGPASVQMWTDYDYGFYPSQQEIATWMGGTCSGVSEDTLAAAVNQFTRTDDAYWDFDAPSNVEAFMARQITSIDNYTPVIAIIDFKHAGVVNGGKWHQEGNWYQWDYTYFHDPEVRANDDYPSARWHLVNCPPGQICSQIISTIMTQGWVQNQNSYGDQIYDSSGCGGGGGCTPENQY